MQNEMIMGETFEKPAIRTLVDQLVNASLSSAARHRSFVVNEVPDGLQLYGTDENMIAVVINGMLQAVIGNTRESCVRISARETLGGKSIEIQVKDTGCFSSFALACDLQTVFPMAQKVGGYLSISAEKQMNSTVIFSFPLDRSAVESH